MVVFGAQQYQVVGMCKDSHLTADLFYSSYNFCNLTSLQGSSMYSKGIAFRKYNIVR